MWITVAILVLLFAIQRFGTDKVGYSFAPIILLWLLLIGGVGLYNLVKYDAGVLRSFNPKYIVDYFRRNKKDGWVSLGDILLVFTGYKLFANSSLISAAGLGLSKEIVFDVCRARIITLHRNRSSLCESGILQH